MASAPLNSQLSAAAGRAASEAKAAATVASFEERRARMIAALANGPMKTPHHIMGATPRELDESVEILKAILPADCWTQDGRMVQERFVPELTKLCTEAGEQRAVAIFNVLTRGKQKTIYVPNKEIVHGLPQRVGGPSPSSTIHSNVDIAMNKPLPIEAMNSVTAPTTLAEAEAALVAAKQDATTALREFNKHLDAPQLREFIRVTFKAKPGQSLDSLDYREVARELFFPSKQEFSTELMGKLEMSTDMALARANATQNIPELKAIYERAVISKGMEELAHEIKSTAQAAVVKFGGTITAAVEAPSTKGGTKVLPQSGRVPNFQRPVAAAAEAAAPAAATAQAAEHPIQATLKAYGIQEGKHVSALGEVRALGRWVKELLRGKKPAAAPADAANAQTLLKAAVDTPGLKPMPLVSGMDGIVPENSLPARFKKWAGLGNAGAAAAHATEKEIVDALVADGVTTLAPVDASPAPVVKNVPPIDPVDQNPFLKSVSGADLDEIEAQAAAVEAEAAKAPIAQAAEAAHAPVSEDVRLSVLEEEAALAAAKAAEAAPVAKVVMTPELKNFLAADVAEGPAIEAAHPTTMCETQAYLNGLENGMAAPVGDVPNILFPSDAQQAHALHAHGTPTQPAQNILFPEAPAEVPPKAQALLDGVSGESAAAGASAEEIIDGLAKASEQMPPEPPAAAAQPHAMDLDGMREKAAEREARATAQMDESLSKLQKNAARAEPISEGFIAQIIAKAKANPKTAIAAGVAAVGALGWAALHRSREDEVAADKTPATTAQR